jgi:hypothetical protein
MKKYPLIGVCIVAVIVLILASLSNVVGFQAIQSTNRKVISDEVNQKELLFQTIVDIANNKEIQRIVLKSQISRSGIFNSDTRLALSKAPVLTKNQLNHMYIVGVMLSKIISKSKIRSMIERNYITNEGVQKQINTIIEKNATLKGEMTQLSSMKCDCENENITSWNFPVLCIIFFPLFMFSVVLLVLGINNNLVFVLDSIGNSLNCFWSYMIP